MLLSRAVPLLIVALCCACLPAGKAEPVQLHGLNYNTRQGPDWDWNKCKTRAQVLTELTLLRRLTNRLRILSLVDCDQGVLVTSVARELGMQLWLGLWVTHESYVLEEEKGQLQYLIQQGAFDDNTILGVTVGSEAIYRDEATADEMVSYKTDVQNMLRQAGISNIPVTIVDTAPMYSANPQLRSGVDVIMTNTFPFWEGIAIEGAVDDLQVDIDWLLNLPESQGKDFVLGETGWPSAGFIRGVGTASPELQTRYFEEAYCRIHVENNWAYYWFTGIDNAWRQEQDPNNTIEGNWGFFFADLRLKDHFVDFEFTCSNGVTYSFAELDLTIPTGFTNAPSVQDPASCQADNGCAGLDLWGSCCPNAEGIFLGCCSNEAPKNTHSASLTPSPTISHSQSPSKVPTTLPVVVKTQSPIAIPSPTMTPTQLPSRATTPPVDMATDSPTAILSPTITPSQPPSKSATIRPTKVEDSGTLSTDPTRVPTGIPTSGVPSPESGTIPATPDPTQLPETDTQVPSLVSTSTTSSPVSLSPTQSKGTRAPATPPSSAQPGTTEANIATILSRVTLSPGETGAPTFLQDRQTSTTASISSGVQGNHGITGLLSTALMVFGFSAMPMIVV